VHDESAHQKVRPAKPNERKDLRAQTHGRSHPASAAASELSDRLSLCTHYSRRRLDQQARRSFRLDDLKAQVVDIKRFQKALVVIEGARIVGRKGYERRLVPRPYLPEVQVGGPIICIGFERLSHSLQQIRTRAP
jgi:hypothetical protein